MDANATNYDQKSGLAFWFAAFGMAVAIAAWTNSGFAALFRPDSAFPKSPEKKVFVSPALDPPPVPIKREYGGALGDKKWPLTNSSRLLGFGTGRIFLVSQSLVFAIDGAGELLWKHKPKEFSTGYFIENGTVLADRIFLPIPEGGFLTVDFDGKLLSRHELAKDKFGNPPLLIDVTGKGVALFTAALAARSNLADTLFAVDNQGVVRWQQELGQEIRYLGSSKRRLFYFSALAEAGDGTKFPMLHVFSDAGELWHTRIELPTKYGVVAGDSGLVYIRGTHSLQAFVGETGRLLWTTQLPPLASGLEISCEKIDYGHGILFAAAGSDDLKAKSPRALYLIDSKDGSLRAVPLPPATVKGCSVMGIAAATGGFYLPGDYLTKIDKYGKLIWRFAPDLSNNRPYRPPIAAVTEGPAGTVFARAGDEEIYCINQHGRKRWASRAYSGSSEFYSQIDGLLLIQVSGTVVALRYQEITGREEGVQ